MLFPNLITIVVGGFITSTSAGVISSVTNSLSGVTVGAAAKECGAGEALSCCSNELLGDDCELINVSLSSLLQLSVTCGATPACCTVDTTTGLINEAEACTGVHV